MHVHDRVPLNKPEYIFKKKKFNWNKAEKNIIIRWKTEAKLATNWNKCNQCKLLNGNK